MKLNVIFSILIWARDHNHHNWTSFCYLSCNQIPRSSRPHSGGVRVRVLQSTLNIQNNQPGQLGNIQLSTGLARVTSNTPDISWWLDVDGGGGDGADGGDGGDGDGDGGDGDGGVGDNSLPVLRLSLRVPTIIKSL